MPIEKWLTVRFSFGGCVFTPVAPCFDDTQHRQGGLAGGLSFTQPNGKSPLSQIPATGEADQGGGHVTMLMIRD